MRLSLFVMSSLTATCITAGIASAEELYYNPANVASPTGLTVGNELYRTIGCPGRALLDPACKENIAAPAPVEVAAPAPVPAPVEVAAPAPAPVEVVAPAPVEVAATAPIQTIGSTLPPNPWAAYCPILKQ